MPPFRTVTVPERRCRTVQERKCAEEDKPSYGGQRPKRQQQRHKETAESGRAVNELPRAREAPHNDDDDSQLSDDAGVLPTVLKALGRASYWFGWNHNSNNDADRDSEVAAAASSVVATTAAVEKAVRSDAAAEDDDAADEAIECRTEYRRECSEPVVDFYVFFPSVCRSVPQTTCIMKVRMLLNTRVTIYWIGCIDIN